MNRPRRLDPLAERVLSLLSGRSECDQIVLGGYLALQHYLDYRTSHDIPAWWSDRADPAAERVIRQVMQQVTGEAKMALRTRAARQAGRAHAIIDTITTELRRNPVADLLSAGLRACV